MLVDQDGATLAPRAIPFLRIYPDGRRVLQMIDRGEAMFLLACGFIARGGRYGVYVTDDGAVNLVALTKTRSGDEVAIASETVENNIALLSAVDRIVRKSINNENAAEDA